ncbi:MCE family protein [Rhodococcus oryzae]|uniref:MCE family protein n=1 Tax=Rhodococcus oryzae TaxID=2571143 RepID=A0ABY2RMV2_9NOCA|nr:MlaD family protein [Rhodococcus oryzae]TJZ79628.1 MCE family protein [Rhodococcus oryzae]
MRSALVRWQLVAFALVAIVGLLYVGAKYVRLDNLLGFGQYTVQADFADSGGIFTNAEVSYRGVPVGTVGDLHLTDDGVLVDLKINTSAPEIPSSAKAVVANRSAIGEQYVDLQPSSDEGPYLEDGSLIVRQDTATPVPVEEVLASTNALVRSVPLKALNTTVTELGKAFNGKGDDLQVLVDSLNTLSQEGIDNLPQTLTLIRDTRTVLDTQSEQSSAIRQFSSDLDLVAAQLRASDPDLRRLIETGTAASNEVGSLIDSAGPALTTDLDNLALVTAALGPRTLALNALLMFLPGLAAGASTAAPGDGTLHQGLLLETNNPPPCTQGYEGTHEILAQMKRENPDFDPTRDEFPLNMNANCTTPLGSVTGVRSANRIVYADPATPQPWDNKPKVDPDKLNLNPIATQLAPLLGITPK